MSRRLHETLGDYVALAINPALIMALVGSLMFFLLQVFYHGPYDVRLRWVLFWFVAATVLIARISMVEGAGRASLYGIALAIAVLLVTAQLVGTLVVPALLLAIAWWCAHRLTYDCTELGREEEAAAEGLLGSLGWDDDLPPTASPHNSPKSSHAPAPDPSDKQQPTPTPLPTTSSMARGHRAISTSDQPPSSQTAPPNNRQTEEKQSLGASLWRLLVRSERDPSRPRGLWVVYFSLAALPIFGVGQGIIASVAPQQRRYAFGLLLVYLASALGLLTSTSFLTVRRYLRRRGVNMPTETAAAWVGGGSALALIILLAALVLPKPQAEYSLPSLARAAVRRWKASPWAILRDSPAEGPGAASNRAPRQAQQKPPHAASQPGQGRGAASSHTSPSPANASQAIDQATSSSSHTSRGASPTKTVPSHPTRPNSGNVPNNSQSNTSSNSPNTNANAAAPNAPSGPTAAGGPNNRNAPSGQSANRNRNVGQRNPPDRAGQSSSSRSSQSPGSQPSPPRAQPTPANTSSAPSHRETASGLKKLNALDQSSGNAPDSANRKPSASATRPNPPAAPPPRPFRPTLSYLLKLLRWLTLALIAVAVVVLILRKPAMVFGWLRQLWASIVELCRNVFGLLARNPKAPAAKPATAPPARRAFASYADPFRHGKSPALRHEALVRYSFAAFEAWAYEHGLPREPQQTCVEFCRHVARHFPELASEARQLGRDYAQLAYGNPHEAPAFHPSARSLRHLWRKMRRMRPTPPMAETGV